MPIFLLGRFVGMTAIAALVLDRQDEKARYETEALAAAG